MINCYKSTTQTIGFTSLVKLLGQGDSTEIMQFEIEKGKRFFINPSIRPETYEFYYIVSGKIEFGDKIYNAYDYFDVDYITESHGFKAIENTVFINFTSSTGEFDNAKKFNTVLVEKLEAV